MISRALEQLLTVVAGSESSNTAETTAAAEDPSPDLFLCTDCAVTYISHEMDSCPNCTGPVEPTPTFAELGIETTETVRRAKGS